MLVLIDFLFYIDWVDLVWFFFLIDCIIFNREKNEKLKKVWCGVFIWKLNWMIKSWNISEVCVFIIEKNLFMNVFI